MERSFIQCVKDEMRDLVTENCSGLLREICFYHLQNPGKMLRPQMIQNLGAIYSVSSQDLIMWAVMFRTLSQRKPDSRRSSRRRRNETFKAYGMESLWL